jgi:hypothetical protein
MNTPCLGIDLARLTFVEQQAGKLPVFRTAVSLTWEDLTKLRDLLDSSLVGVSKIPLQPKTTDG